MLWFFIWLALVIGALVVLGSLAFGLFRKGMELLQEMGEAAELLGQAAEQVERLQRPGAQRPAVFEDPHELRRERDRRRRQRHKQRAHRRQSALSRTTRRTMRTTQAGG
ncbi:MAG TPA: hypothetical protein VFX52_00205 [Nocardioidaceae bacterium]|nr:hypothetical protein [Nocardioidaceae bacterium]